VIDVSFAGTPGQWPVTESISMEFVGVPSSCVNVAIGTPCLAHERRPALWFAVFKSDQAEHAVGPFRAHKANTSVPDANGNMVSTDVAAVRLDLPPSSWIFALASLSGGRTDATFAVSARYRAADGPEAVEIPFEGIPGTNMITVSGIPESPPPSRPPPPAPPPGSPLVMDGLQLWLDASRQDVQCDGVCAAGSVPGLFKDVLPAGRHFQERGNCQWNSQSVNGASIGYFDVNTCGGFQRAAWAEWLQAGDVTAEVWAKLRGYRSGNTGIVTHFVGGAGKHNWMWNGGGGFHVNGMKGSGNFGSGTIQNEWTRFALVGRANDGYHFWQNGDDVARMGYSGDLKFSGANTLIGVGSREDGVEPANAQFSVVRIYNRALTDEELRQNFEQERTKFGI